MKRIPTLNLWLQALSGIRLVEKIESIGLDTIVASTSGILHPTLQGALYTRRCLPSPMAQLTNLKGTLTSPSIDKNLSDLEKPGVSGRERGTSARGSQRQRRPDLGTVSGTVTATENRFSGPLGTISTMLFGRKGGLS